jgi:hypothetical protein
MIGLLMNDKLERTWKEIGMACFNLTTSICLEGLRKTTWEPIRNCQCPDRHSNQALPQYKSEASMPEPTFPASYIIQGVLSSNTNPYTVLAQQKLVQRVQNEDE